MKKGIWCFVVLLCCSVVLADVSIKDYPFFFVHDNLFDASYVLGDEAPSMDVVTATILSTNLARFDDVKTAVGTTLLDSEIRDIRKINAIVIGNPCVSQAAAVLEGNPDDCYDGLEDGTGYIKTFQHGNKVQLLITGITPEDRQVVAKRLAHLDLNNIDSSAYSMKTGTGSRLPSFENVPSITGGVVGVSDIEVPESPKKTVKKTKTYNSAGYDNIEVVRPVKRGFFALVWAVIMQFFSSIFG